MVSQTLTQRQLDTFRFMVTVGGKCPELDNARYNGAECYKCIFKIGYDGADVSAFGTWDCEYNLLERMKGGNDYEKDEQRG